MAQGRHRHRRQVRSHADYAVAATRHQREGLVIIAAENTEIRWSIPPDRQDLGDVAGGFLDGHDVRDFRQTQHGLGFDVGAGTARYIVQYDGLVRRFGDRLEVLVHAFLGRFVVIRHDHQPGIGAPRLEQPDVPHRRFQGIRSDAGDHGTGEKFPGHPQQFHLLIIFQTRRLGRRAERDQEVHAAFNLAAHQGTVARVIHGPVRERRHQRRSQTFDPQHIIILLKTIL